MAGRLQARPFLYSPWHTYLNVRFGPTFLFARQTFEASSKNSCVNSLCISDSLDVCLAPEFGIKPRMWFEIAESGWLACIGSDTCLARVSISLAEPGWIGSSNLFDPIISYACIT